MQKHKFNIFPEMQSEDFDRLKQDLSVNGYDAKNPIWMYQGGILDGWNRQKACGELGVTPVYKDFTGSDVQAVEFVMRTNKRRNLNSSQWACIATEADELIGAIKEQVRVDMAAKVSAARVAEEERKRKIDELLAKSGEKKSIIIEIPEEEESEEVTQLIVEAAVIEQPKSRIENESSHKIATTFNTNRTYINEAQRLKRDNPVMFEKVKAGEKTITEVKKEEKIQERVEMIEKQREDIKNNKLPALTGLYGIMSVDPPWPYGREYDPESSRVANPYPEMTIEQIKAIELPVEDNSVMFLWTTHKFLPDAFDILKKWGFEYKATIVWNKEKMGMGAWFRMQCEFCLFAIKGNPIFQNTTERDIITESRREHSRKPDSFYKIVDRVCVGRKLEYFSREQREGWDIFGNDIEKF